MAVSLLPKDQRGKEEEAKKKAKKAMHLPVFKMHLPEEQLKKEAQTGDETSSVADNFALPQKEEAGIEFGGQEEAATSKKGIFKISKKKLLPFPEKKKPVPIVKKQNLKLKKIFGEEMAGLLGLIIVLVLIYFAGIWAIKNYGQEQQAALGDLTSITNQTVLEINTLELR